MPGETVLSVRGDAQHAVAPDYVVLRGTLTAAASTRPVALETLRGSQDELTAALEQLGGTPLTLDTQRDDLTWSFGSISVHQEHDLDKSAGRRMPTGRVFAAVSVLLTARLFAQLSRLAAALAQIENASLDDVRWRVDANNPAWQAVRAAAISAALAKARDYATALGGAVSHIDHIADAGLLGAEGHRQNGASFVRASALSAESSHGGDGVPTLDPVPQEISAVIEARVTAYIEAPPASA